MSQSLINSNWNAMDWWRKSQNGKSPEAEELRGKLVGSEQQMCSHAYRNWMSVLPRLAIHNATYSTNVDVTGDKTVAAQYITVHKDFQAHVNPVALVTVFICRKLTGKDWTKTRVLWLPLCWVTDLRHRINLSYKHEISRFRQNNLKFLSLHCQDTRTFIYGSFHKHTTLFFSSSLDWSKRRTFNPSFTIKMVYSIFGP